MEIPTKVAGWDILFSLSVVSGKKGARAGNLGKKPQARSVAMRDRKASVPLATSLQMLPELLLLGALNFPSSFAERDVMWLLLRRKFLFDRPSSICPSRFDRLAPSNGVWNRRRLHKSCE
jgi:hypothetical protein